MDLVLHSDRLKLRPFEASDLDLAVALRTNPDVMKYIGEPVTEQQLVAEMPIATRRCAEGAIGIWCVTDQTTSEKLGTAFLLPMPIEEDGINWDLVSGDDLPESEIEIGYKFMPAVWGKGIATEACTRLLRFAFEKTALEQVVAVIDPDNIASRRVLQKIGLKHEGLRRAYATECPGFRITRRDWMAANNAG